MLRGEITRLRAELDGDDRVRLDQHLEAMARLDARLVTPPAAAVCEVGANPTTRNLDPAAVESQIEIIRAAFACDRTRVASFNLAPENSWDARFIPGVHANCHTASHETTDPDPAVARRAIDSITAYQRWCAEKLATLLDALASVEEAPGVTLLDNTVVVWGMAMSHGGYHTNRNVPIVIAHGANGPFRTGRYLRWGTYEHPSTGGCPRDGACHRAGGGEANNRLLVSLCHGFGLDGITRFGDERFSGPLDGLV